MNLINSKVFTAALLILSFWISFSVISVEVERRQIKQEGASLEAKIDDVNKGNKLMERRIENLGNQKFLEKEARLRLNYKTSGEEVIFVHRDLDSPKASLSEELSSENLLSYKKWWRYLFGY